MKPTRTNALIKADSQSLDGNDIFELAKSGSLYLKTEGAFSERYSDPVPDDDSDDLPVGPISAYKPYTQEHIAMLLRESNEIVKRLKVCCSYLHFILSANA